MGGGWGERRSRETNEETNGEANGDKMLRTNVRVPSADSVAPDMKPRVQGCTTGGRRGTNEMAQRG